MGFWRFQCQTAVSISIFSCTLGKRSGLNLRQRCRVGLCEDYFVSITSGKRGKKHMASARRQEVVLTGLCLSGYFFTGCLATLFPSILPAIIQGFGLSLAKAGQIFPASAVGTLLGGILTGIWSDRVGARCFPGSACSALPSRRAGECLSRASSCWDWRRARCRTASMPSRLTSTRSAAAKRSIRCTASIASARPFAIRLPPSEAAPSGRLRASF